VLTWVRAGDRSLYYLDALVGSLGLRLSCDRKYSSYSIGDAEGMAAVMDMGQRRFETDL
jgi:hypothetical protein